MNMRASRTIGVGLLSALLLFPLLTKASGPEDPLALGLRPFAANDVARAAREPSRKVAVALRRADVQSVELGTEIFFNGELLATAKTPALVPALSVSVQEGDAPVAVGDVNLPTPPFKEDGVYAERITVTARIGMARVPAVMGDTFYYRVKDQKITAISIHEYSRHFHRYTEAFERSGKKVSALEASSVPASAARATGASATQAQQAVLNAERVD